MTQPRASSGSEAGGAGRPAAVCSVDDALRRHVGQWGRGQTLMLLGSSVAWPALAMTVLSMVFWGSDPVGLLHWRCVPGHAQEAACEAAYAAGGRGLCRLDPAAFEWTRPRETIAAAFGQVCGRSWVVAAVNATFFVGFWLGSLVGGPLSDRCGRRLALVLAALATAAACAAAAAAPSPGVLAAMRLLTGFGAAGLPVASFIHATESVGPDCRGRAGIAHQLVYHVGEGTLALAAWALQDWRLLLLACGGACLVAAACAALMPESPTWLMASGQVTEALDVLEWIGARNGAACSSGLKMQAGSFSCSQEGGIALQLSDAAGAWRHGAPGASKQASSGIANDADEAGPGADAQLDSSVHKQAEQQEAAAGGPAGSAWRVSPTVSMDIGEGMGAPDQQLLLPGGPGSVHAAGKGAEGAGAGTAWEQQHCWGALFGHRRALHHFLATCALSFVLASGFYILSLVTDQLHGSLYVNFVATSSLEAPFTVAAMFGVDAYGRKRVLFGGLATMCASCLACWLVPAGAWQVALAMLGRGACSATWAVEYIYSAELFPTSIRSTAVSGTNQVSRLGGVLAPILLHYIVSPGGGSSALPYLLCGAAAAAVSGVLRPLPETRGMGQADCLADMDAAFDEAAAAAAAGGACGASAAGEQLPAKHGSWAAAAWLRDAAAGVWGRRYRQVAAAELVESHA